MERINWSTYKKLQAAMDQINHSYKFSALTLLSWSYYGIKIRFEIVKYDDFQIIFFDAKFNRFINEKESTQQNRIASILKYGEHFILMPIYDAQQINTFDAIYCGFYKLKKIYPIKTNWAIEIINAEQLNQLSDLDYELVYSWNANFIYELAKFKTFAGKKLQKKRNHLNYFLKNHLKDVEVSQIQETDFSDLLNFLWQVNYQKNPHGPSHEYIFFRNFLDHYDFKTMSGIVIREKNNNQVIAFTICHTHNEYYEVFFEKADHNWRGLNQFLISQNLIINNINQKYMDRQDDVEDDNINFSKKSYYPEEIVKTYMIYIKSTNKNQTEFELPIKNSNFLNGSN